MATSFISLDGRGFWCWDSRLEIWMYYIAESIPENDDPFSARYRKHALMQALEGMHGFINLDFDTFDLAAREKFSTWADKTIQLLQKNPELLSAACLNRLRLSGGGVEFQQDVPIAEMLILKDRILGLLLRGEGWDASEEAGLPHVWMDEGKAKFHLK